MSYEIYRIVHFVALTLMFAGLGAYAFAPGGGRPSRSAAALHGLAVLLVLVGGFGMLARRSGSSVYETSQAWVLAKFGAWLALALLPILIRRAGVRGLAAILLAGAVAVGAALAVQQKWLW